ncbi:MAG: hypothetical protein ACM3ON_12070 [Chloroflexota bacterium]
MTGMGALIGACIGALLFVIFGFYRAVMIGGFVAVSLYTRMFRRPLGQSLFERVFVALGAAFAVMWGALFAIVLGAMLGAGAGYVVMRMM